MENNKMQRKTDTRKILRYLGFLWVYGALIAILLFAVLRIMCTEKTIATVINVEAVSSQVASDTYYYPTYEYTVGEESYTFQGTDKSKNKEDIKIGITKEIRYSPVFPTMQYVHNDKVFLVIGLLLIAGEILIVTTKKRVVANTY